MFACHWLMAISPRFESVVPPAEPDGRRKTVDQHVVPLVEDGDSPVAVGKTGEREGAIGIALGEREVLAVRIAEADVALGEGEAVVS